MGKVIVGLTMSLDGFINDPQRSVAALYPDFAGLRETDAMRESISQTGAVVMGRHAFAMGDPDTYADAYEYQVPIFVVTHAAPERHPKENARLTFTFVTDGVESAIRQARLAAGERNVTVVGGAQMVRQCLGAGLADELHVDVVPVLLGGGLRLFDGVTVALEDLGVRHSPGRAGLRYRVANR